MEGGILRTRIIRRSTAGASFSVTLVKSKCDIQGKEEERKKEAERPC